MSDIDAPELQQDPAEYQVARQLVRRIGICFLIVVACLPFIAHGRAGSGLLLVAVPAAIFAFTQALRLRALTRKARREP